MKRPHLLWAALCLNLLLTGCGIGGYWMEGVGGKERDEYLKSIKPYLHNWEKPRMTVEGRQDDWIKCGGMNNGSYSPDERLPGETDDFAAARRKQRRLDACMEMKGYRFTGNVR